MYLPAFGSDALYVLRGAHISIEQIIYARFLRKSGIES